MEKRVFLAVDIGASSGRVVAGSFDGRRLTVEDVHRFENGPVAVGEHLHWDLLAQWSQVQSGLRAAAAMFNGAVASVGVDTWGVDFTFLGPGDELLGNPFHYRDHRTDGALARAFARVPRSEIFAATGLQFMQFNSLYQMLAMQEARSAVLAVAQSFLMIPDLFHWLLSGEKANEVTNASTTQFYDPLQGDWARGLLGRFGLPTHFLGALTPAGTSLGSLRRGVAEATGLTNVQVVLPGTHDTASAVLAAPATGGAPWCYISSGTWSLMGVEIPAPIINDSCLALNFTNEAGVGGTTRLLKNIGGLWLIQECRRVWKEGGREFAWEDLMRMAAAAAPLVSSIDPDAPPFLSPTNMPEAIASYCRRTGQMAPAGEGPVLRCALESLALRYRQVLSWLEQLTGQRIERVHIVGGGTQNRLLCQLAADATGREVLAGPVEATAIGNLLMQAVAAGEVGSIAEARAIIAESFPLDRYQPRPSAAWDEAFARFERHCGSAAAT